MSAKYVRTQITARFGSHRVLYWHNVHSGKPGLYNEGVTASEFESRIIALKQAGFRFISLSEALERVRNQAKPEPTISLSTDDGFACNHSEILPILKRHSLPLCLFLIGKCLDNRALAWNHKLLIIRSRTNSLELLEALKALASRYQLRLSEDIGNSLFSLPMGLKDDFADELWERFCPNSQAEYLRINRPFLSTAQTRDLLDHGAELGSHSFSHPDFSRLSYPEMRSELELSKQAIQAETGIIPRFFAYPYGRFSSPALSSKLCQDSSLDLCLGARYSLRDNRRPQGLWQRQKMEQDSKSVELELWLRPWLRALKDLGNF